MSTDLKSRLFQAARLWSDAQGEDVPMSRIGKRVAGDANIFVRLEVPEATLQVATLERFAAFLADGANWPDGLVPREVCEFAHVVGISSAACAVSPDSEGADIGDAETQEAAE